MKALVVAVRSWAVPMLFLLGWVGLVGGTMLQFTGRTAGAPPAAQEENEVILLYRVPAPVEDVLPVAPKVPTGCSEHVCWTRSGDALPAAPVLSEA